MGHIMVSATGSGVRLYDVPHLTPFILIGWAGASCLLLGPPGFNWCFSFAPELLSYLAPMDLHRQAAFRETAVWPIPFLINMFTALKRSQFYFILNL